MQPPLPPPMMPIALKKQASGTGTFTDSVFQLLHRELDASLRQLRSMATSAAVAGHGAAKPREAISSKATSKAPKPKKSKKSSSRGAPPEAPATNSVAVDRSRRSVEGDDGVVPETLDEILSLLGSVIETEVCQKFLTTSSWIGLLVGLLHFGPIGIQSKVLHLAETLLPLCTPSNLVVELPVVGGAPVASGASGNVPTATARCDGLGVVKYFLSIVSMAHMPTALVLSGSAAVPVTSSLFWMSTVGVHLLRRLFATPTWQVTVATALEEGFSGLAAASEWSKAYRCNMAGTLSALCVLGGFLDRLQAGSLVLQRGKRLAHVLSVDDASGTADVQAVDISSDGSAALRAATGRGERLSLQELTLVSQLEFDIAQIPDSLIDQTMGLFRNLLRKVDCRPTVLGPRSEGGGVDSAACEAAGVVIRLPDGRRLEVSAEASIESTKRQVHAFAEGSIEWIEELHLVQQSSWERLDDGSDSLRARGVTAGQALWAVVAPHRAQDIAFDLLVARVHAFKAASTMTKHKPVSRDVLAAGVDDGTLLSLLARAAKGSEAYGLLDLPLYEGLAQLMVERWHSIQRLRGEEKSALASPAAPPPQPPGASGDADIADSKDVAPDRELMEEKPGPNDASAAAPPKSSARPRHQPVSLGFDQCVEQSLEMIGVPADSLLPDTAGFMHRIVNHLLNTLLEALWERVASSGMDVASDSVLIATVQDVYDAHGLHELLEVSMETINLHRLNGWEEDANAWADVAETLHILMDSHGVQHGVQVIEDLAPGILISCLEALVCEIFDMVIELLQQQSDGEVDGSDLTPVVIREVLEDHGSPIFDLILDMEQSEVGRMAVPPPPKSASLPSLESAPLKDISPPDADGAYCGGAKAHESPPVDDEEADDEALQELSDLGFPYHWCTRGLAENQNNVELALNWIVSHGDQLAAEDEQADQEEMQRSDVQSNDDDRKVDAAPEPSAESVVDLANEKDSEIGDEKDGGAVETPGTAPRTSPRPIVENPTLYTAFYAHGLYGRFWPVPTPSVESPCVVLTFKARAADEVYVQFSHAFNAEAAKSSPTPYYNIATDGSADPPMRICEVLFGADGNSVSTVSLYGDVIASAHHDAGVCDATSFVSYKVVLQASGGIEVFSGTSGTDGTPFLCKVDAGIPLSKVGSFNLSGGNSRVLFRDIAVTTASVPASEPCGDTTNTPVRKAPTKDRMEHILHDSECANEALLARPTYACLDDCLLDRNDRRRGRGGLSRRSIAHVWQPASSREEFLTVLAEMEESEIPNFRE